MEKVLLAIEGVAPDHSTFSYALALCKRMRAGLDILQIFSPHTYRKYLKRVKKGARHSRNVFEDAMVAVTFAEAGQRDIAGQMEKHSFEKIDRLIPKSEKDGIDYHLTLKSGNADEEIVRYVCGHRDVVLTIYDASASQDKQERASVRKRKAVRQIGQKLSTPFVIMREM